MSKYVKSIVDSINKYPESYYHDEIPIFGKALLSKDKRIRIWGHGNSALLSIISLRINGKSIKMSYMDKYRLERALNRWYKNASLQMVLFQP